MVKTNKYILWFGETRKADIALVGGKNASSGEMFSLLGKKGVNVPDGFSITTKAYWHYLKENKIDAKLKEIFRDFDPDNIADVRQRGKAARDAIMNGIMPSDLEQAIYLAYKKMEAKYGARTSVAVRSSGVTEDQPGASFAGQFESFLNTTGQTDLLLAVKKCFASGFNDRAIVYRREKGFSQTASALSVGVQKMVRSDLASSGIIFTLDSESGFRDVVLINSIWGVGELIVKGRITADQFYVFKPALKQGYKSIIIKNLGRKNKKYVFSKSGGLKEEPVLPANQLKFSLTDEEILKLAKWAVIIEEHYKCPQDIEWAKDGKTGGLFIVQSRPETVQSTKGKMVYEEYQLKTSQKPIIEGIAVGDKIGSGRARVISDIKKISDFKKGDVLVAKMTDPDWMMVMRLASAIITDEGSRICHAAIVSRELGIPCVVGARVATKKIKNGRMVTVDCTQGSQGRIYDGQVDFKVIKHNLTRLPKLKTKIMLNIGAPDIAFKTSFLPNDGVGLARIEFILADKIRVHPLALYHYNRLKAAAENTKLIKEIDEITVEHKDKKEFFVKELAEGIAQIAAAFYPKEVIVRFSDFKTNEYRNLLAGELFEGEESNPMLGFRGASRYLDKEFQPAFLMECQAIKRVRDVFGLKNVSVMVPFCRTLEEGRGVMGLINAAGLKRGPKPVKVFVMCEIPSNVILADEFLKIFDGMSIGSNDLSQLILGVDRDNSRIALGRDERNPAVKEMLKQVISVCRAKKKYCGICGQAPSDFPDFAQFLVKQGIESISLNPDSVIKTILALARHQIPVTSRVNGRIKGEAA